MTTRELIAKSCDLPPVSPAAIQLMNLLGQQEIGNDEVVRVLKCDSVMTAKLLRLCNSPGARPAEPVTSVDQAVLLLGYQQLLHMVLSLALGKTMTAPLAGYGVESAELWRHSVVTATAAEIVASNGLDWSLDPAVAFTAGLLHDIGKVVLNLALSPELQLRVRSRIESGSCSRAEAEREVLGVDHAQTGAALLESWNVPAELVEAVANHHQPVLTPRPRLSAVTHLANCLAHLVGSAPGWEGYAMRVDEQVIKTLGLTAENLQGLIIAVQEAFQGIEEFIAFS
jgi:putative nucleotidyltransferase with HDIG domain